MVQNVGRLAYDLGGSEWSTQNVRDMDPDVGVSQRPAESPFRSDTSGSVCICIIMHIYIYMYKYHIPHPNHAWLTVPLLLHNMNPWSLVSSSRSRRPKRSVHQTQVCFKKNPAYVKVRLLFGPLGPIFLRLNTVLLLGLYALQLRAHSRLCRLEGWARTHSVPACVILLGDSPGCNKGKS